MEQVIRQNTPEEFSPLYSALHNSCWRGNSPCEKQVCVTTATYLIGGEEILAVLNWADKQRVMVPDNFRGNDCICKVI